MEDLEYSAYFTFIPYTLLPLNTCWQYSILGYSTVWSNVQRILLQRDTPLDILPDQPSMLLFPSPSLLAASMSPGLLLGK